MRTLVAAAAAAGIAATVGGAGVALAQTDPAPSIAAGGTAVMKLTAHETSEKTIDVARKGFSVGDQDLSSARLMQGGKKVGTLDGVCQVTFATKPKADELCSQTFNLAKGTIASAGVVVSSPTGPQPFDWAITGGTGAYTKARGFVHVIPGNKTIHMTVHVTR